jgi:sec-independent protein translocase protein TatA
MLHLHFSTLALLTNLFDNPLDLAVIAIIALLLFGKRLPDLAKSLGKSIVEFKKGLNQTTDEIKKASQVDAPPDTPEIPSAKSTPSMGAGAAQPNPRHIKQVTSVSEEP